MSEKFINLGGTEGTNRIFFELFFNGYHCSLLFMNVWCFIFLNI